METEASGPVFGRKWRLMSAFRDKLAPKQEAAILAMLNARNLEEAARSVGIPARTLHRWLKEPMFENAYREARRLSYAQAISRLQQMSSAAVTVLGKVLVDPNTPASTKVRAADSILNHAAKAIEIEDIEVRLVYSGRSERPSEGVQFQYHWDCGNAGYGH